MQKYDYKKGFLANVTTYYIFNCVITDNYFKYYLINLIFCLVFMIINTIIFIKKCQFIKFIHKLIFTFLILKC